MSDRPRVDRLEADFLAPVRGAYDDWARAMADEPPCECDMCRIQRDVESTRGQIDRIMAGVDMPGRIVDDVRPDQRGA